MTIMQAKCYLCILLTKGKDGVYRHSGWSTFSGAPWQITSDLSGKYIAATFMETSGESYHEADRSMKDLILHMSQYGREPWVQLRHWFLGTQQEQLDVREAIRMSSHE